MSTSSPVVVRWLAAYRGRPADHATMAWAEIIGIGRERAAAPQRLGRSLVLAERPSARIGLGYGAEAVRRAFWRDVWSEPASDGRLLAGATPGSAVNAAARRGWRDWDRFARFWARRRPAWHAEAARWAAELAAELGLPVLAIRPLEGHPD